MLILRLVRVQVRKEASIHATFKFRLTTSLKLQSAMKTSTAGVATRSCEATEGATPANERSKGVHVIGGCVSVTNVSLIFAMERHRAKGNPCVPMLHSVMQRYF